MAYRFDGVDDLVEFNISPINLATFGPYTWAALLKRNATGVVHVILAVGDSSGGTNRITWRINTSNILEVASASTRAGSTAWSSTSVWYLFVVTSASGTVNPRFHVHNGTSWAHENATGTIAARTLSSGDRLAAGARAGFGNYISADVVCAGIKKTDSADATVETLSPTSFTAWTGFGFDWLIGFDSSLESAGILQDQASPGTGDEVAITGTSQVSDPGGWSWGAAAPAFVPQIVIT